MTDSELHVTGGVLLFVLSDFLHFLQPSLQVANSFQMENPNLGNTQIALYLHSDVVVHVCYKQ